MPAQIWRPRPVRHLYALRTAIYLPAATVAAQVGVTLDTYYSWEEGKTWPSQPHRRKLARVLRTTEGYLLGREED